MNFFIYPEKDTTIYKQKKLRLLNAGSDEVIELTNLFDEATGHDVSRILIKFNVDELINQNIYKKNAKYILNLKIMTSSELLENDIISVYPLKKDWVEGNGRFIPSSDAKEYSKGANWKYTDGETEMWIAGSHYDATGGGDWFETEVCIDKQSYPSKIDCAFQFQKNFSDVKIDVTKIVKYFLEGAITNHGFIVKFENETTSGGGNVKFYSSDTNTIYSPYIQIKYNDYIFDPCSSPLSKVLVCKTKIDPTPTPTYNSGSLCSGTLGSGSHCSGSLDSGTLDSGTLEYEVGDLHEGHNDTFNQDEVKEQELNYELNNVVFKNCEQTNYDNETETNYEIKTRKNVNKLNQVFGNDLVPTIKRLKKEYRSFSRERLSVGIREKYPQKTFSNKSDYSMNNYTLDTLKYSVRDAETEETLIEFDEFSRISCDSSGHYFNFDFSCLPTGRVYKFLLLLESDYGDFLHEDKRRFIVRV